MLFINEAIHKILETGCKRQDIAHAIEVTPALISTWLQVENDFTPRFKVAQKIWAVYGIQVYPYAIEALNETLPTSN